MHLIIIKNGRITQTYYNPLVWDKSDVSSMVALILKNNGSIAPFKNLFEYISKFLAEHFPQQYNNSINYEFCQTVKNIFKRQKILWLRFVKEWHNNIIFNRKKLCSV